MEADEMMDEDLFADLYGDEEPKKIGNTKSAVASNGPVAASAKPAASPASNIPSASGNEKAPDQGQISNAPTAAGAHTQPAQQSLSNEINGQGAGEDVNNYHGWDSQQNKSDANNGGNNDYQGYGGYEQEGDAYGNYSGDGNGNMVDVGGSTAIKEDGKMFIGGLNWETTDESLKNYFSQYGEVTECTVMRDGTTGRSRGFGFLTFKDPKTVNIVMVKEHYLDGKIIDPKRAIPRDEQEKTSKIFVGGVSQEATETDFREYFTQFGRVLDATLMMDKDTGRPRGFGFVTFDSESAVENALNHPSLEIMSKPIEVKKAQPRGNPRDRNAAGGHFDDRDDSRGGFNRTDRRVFDRDGATAGGAGGAGYSQQGPNGNATVGQVGQGVYNGLSPAMMAQYWQRMQQYMAAYLQQQQQQTPSAGRGRGMAANSPTPLMNPMMMNPSMMTPQMMQQMQMAQQGQGMGPNPGGMGVMGMNGMGGMGAQGMGGIGGPQGQQQQQHQQGSHGGYGGPQGGPQGGYGNGGYGHQQEGGYDSHGQQQQHGVHHGNMGHVGPVDPRYQRQAKDYQSHHQRDFNPQQQSSWEGMYDDISPQGPQHQQQQQQNMNNGRYPSNSAQAQAYPQAQSQGNKPPTGPNQLMRPQNQSIAQNQHHHPNQNQSQQQRIPPAGPASFNNSSSNSSSQPTSGPPPNAPTGPRNARNPTGPAAFRGPGARGGAGPGMQGGGGVGPMRGPGGFSRGAAVGGMQQGQVGGHGYHPYARNTGNQGGAGGGGPGVDRGGY